MRKTNSELGKLAMKKFWTRFRLDSEFRDRIIKSRKMAKGTKWIKRASLMGVKARLKNYKKKEKEFLIRLKNFSCSNKFLSRLCGFLIGDGSISVYYGNNIPSYEIRFYPDNLCVAKLYIKTLRQIYGKIPKLKNLGKYFSARIKSKFICKHLTNITSFKSLSWKIPKKILSSREDKIEFIKAYFDCEAYVGKRMIQVQSVNSTGLNQIRKLLKEFEINSKIYKYVRKNRHWNPQYILCVLQKDSRKKYLNDIGFNHPNKLQKLKQTFAGFS